MGDNSVLIVLWHLFNFTFLIVTINECFLEAEARFLFLSLSSDCVCVCVLCSVLILRFSRIWLVMMLIFIVQSILKLIAFTCSMEFVEFAQFMFLIWTCLFYSCDSSDGFGT